MRSKIQVKSLLPIAGLLMVLGSSHARAETDLVISEVYANSPGSVSDSGKEWIELTNATADTNITLEGATLTRLDGTAQSEEWRITLVGAPSLDAGESIVMSTTDDLGIDLCFSFTPYLLPSTFSLGNSGVQFLQIQTLNGEGETVKYSNSNSFPDGQSRERADFTNTDDLDTAWTNSTCELTGNTFGTPGKSIGECLGESDFLPETECGGTPIVTTDGGVIFEPVPSELDGGGAVDTSNNQVPNGSLTVASSTENSAVLRLSASDSDHPSVSVTLYYALTNQETAGQEIAQGIFVTADGTSLDYEWVFGDTPEGTYYPFAAFTDAYGARSYAFGDRAVIVGAPDATMSFSITAPDGINDTASATSAVSIEWSILPATEGVVALYYDSDSEGFDGIPIVSGLSAASTGPRTYRWAPDNVDPGNYAIYGVLSWKGGQEVAYAPGFVEVTGEVEGCQCTQHHKKKASYFAFILLGMLLLPLRLKRPKLSNDSH